MKLFVRNLWRIGCFLLAVVYLFSCFSQFIPTDIFSYTVFFALLFPYFFLAIFIVAIVFLFSNKKLALVFFLLLLPGIYNAAHVLAISPLSSWQMKKDTANVRIMTWNVTSFINPALQSLPDSKMRRDILHTITEYNPDIICFQEYTNMLKQTQYVASVRHELDSMGYKYIVSSNDQLLKTSFGFSENGVAICSKTPIGDTGRLRIRNDRKTEYLLYADLKIKGKPVRIHTAHLMSFAIFPDSAQGYNGKKLVAKKLYRYKRSVQYKLRDVEIAHDEQAAKISHLLAESPYPVIYTGDCNATSTMYSYRLLKGNKRDAFLRKGNGIGATFYNIVPTLRIDMIFPDRHFDVKQCTVIHRKLGDHYPVVADISWKD